jgi:S1-C subfamily serine protease
VFIGQEPAFDDTVAVTTEFSALDSATQKAKSSVVKVSAWGCGSAAVGSGFVVDGALIITNAHVIAGAERIIVQETNVALSAQPVLFNPSLDIAILSTTPAPVTTILSLYDQQASPGAITSIIGYPGGGNLTTSDGIILSTINALGYDIYGQTPITRQIYAFRGRIVPGNSGGPLINTSGKVVGLIFGNSTTRPNTGFALPSTQIQNALKTIAAKTTPVSTGNCTSR